MRRSEPERTIFKIIGGRRKREFLGLILILVGLVVVLATIAGAQLMACRPAPPLTAAKVWACLSPRK
jgi:hypothetical protein